MKRLFKWALRLVLLLVVLLVALLLSLDSIGKALAERRIRAQTGMDVQIGRFSVGLLSPVIAVEHFKLYNTPGFGGTPFLDIPELHVEYDRVDLVRRKLHITLLRLNLAELDVVKDETGQTNLTSLRNIASRKSSAGNGGGRFAPGFEFTGIDVLNLSLGKVRFVDLKDPRRSRELNLDVHDCVLKNVKSEADLYDVLFLIWLRNGGNLKGTPILSPPEIIPVPGQPVSKTGGTPGETRPASTPR